MTKVAGAVLREALPQCEIIKFFLIAVIVHLCPLIITSGNWGVRGKDREIEIEEEGRESKGKQKKKIWGRKRGKERVEKEKIEREESKERGREK